MNLDEFITDTPREEETHTPSYRNTGIEYFDKKEKLSPFDALVAKNAGVDVSLKADIDLKSRNLSGTKSMQDIFDVIKGMDSTNEMVQLADKEAGIFSGLARKLNHATGGFTPLSEDNARYDVLNLSNTYNTARAATNGKTTNMAIEDSKRTFDSGLRGSKEMYSRLGQSFNQQSIYLENLIAEHESKGFTIPPIVQLKLAEYKNKGRYLTSLEANKEKFDKEKFNGIGAAILSYNANQNEIQKYERKKG